MPRLPRITLPNYPHHVIQRGNNKVRVFRRDSDHTIYLSLLSEYSVKWKCKTHAYCLMPNHIHLLVTPQEENSLSKMLHAIALRYAQIANKRFSRTGRLWESRFYSCIVGNDNYLLAVCRYIEMNPVKAGLAEKPEKYKWSSARHNLLDIEDKIITGSLFKDSEHRDAYKDLLETYIEDKGETDLILRSTFRGVPLADERFIARLEKKFNCKLSLRNRGRPNKL